MFSPKSFKDEFPIFNQHPDLVYLDSAATTQKPIAVIEGITRFYEQENANIHRGIYDLAAEATEKYEAVRSKAADWLHARSPQEIIFTSGTTASINLIAQSFLAPQLKAGDNVVISIMEHHANFIPWQMLCQQSGAELRVLSLNRSDELKQEQLSTLLDENTKMLALVQISNTLGTINPVEEIIEQAHQKGIPVLIDGAQSVAHYEVDLQAMGCDFFVCSAHKFYGPTGVGLLYGKSEHLDQMLPVQYGGSMIRQVSVEKTTFAPVPQRFEAGTPNIAGVIGMGYAIDFVQQLNQTAIRQHLNMLTSYATEQLSMIEGLRIIGKATQKNAIISFMFEEIHPHDIATVIGAQGLALRAGHHCTQPLMDFYSIPATMRASFAPYNTRQDIDRLIATLQDLQNIFL